MHDRIRATLGSVAHAGEPITLWCNNYACAYRPAYGAQYRAVLSAADLMALAEQYGDEANFIDFGARLRCQYSGPQVRSCIGLHRTGGTLATCRAGHHRGRMSETAGVSIYDRCVYYAQLLRSFYH